MLAAACSSSSDAQPAPTTTETTAAPAASSTSVVDFGETEGCTASFWASHVELWDDETDPNIGDEGRMRPTSTLAEVMSSPEHEIAPFESADPEVAGFGTTTMLEALAFVDGGGVSGAGRTLLRAAAASFLNASYEGIEFPFRRFVTGENGNPSLGSQVTTALASGDFAVMLEVAATLDRANQLSCPL